MKAAVCYEHGKPLVVEDISIDPPGKREVKVRMAATAICHSDIHVLRGELIPQVPIVAGHESSGYIEEIGEGVTSVNPGDPVVIALVANCGHCHHCLTGLPHLCQFEWPLKTQSRLHNKKGQSLAQMVKVGSLAEYTIGTYPVIAVDILDSKLEAAKKFGATHNVNAKMGDPIKAVQDLTSKRGADYIFITVGSVAAMQQGFKMSAPRGTTVLVGLPPPNDTLALSPFEFIGTERVLTGSFMGSTNLQVDIPMLVELYQSGKLKLDELITHRYSLEQVNEAIESVESGEALRNIIMF
jgi:S-(hydroxymethyl)glutathione dehydrogenase/alcohol dehydrogenase